ncbi:MAG: hypothetical protein SGBAC_008645 [Bacillariaceae sp.]
MVSIKSILFICTYSAAWGVATAHTRFAVPSSSRAFLVQQRQQIPEQQLLVHSILVRGGAGYYDDGDDDPYYSQDPRGRNNDDYYYDERDDDYPPSGRQNSRSGGAPSVTKMLKSGNRKIGLPMLGVGAALTVLGMSLFFNKTLMRLGNLCFVAGVPLTVGPGRTMEYLVKKEKARATACLALGIFLVFAGWPVVGIILEAFGFLNLFGNMFPIAMAVLKNMPVIGPLLKGEFGGRKNNRQSRDDGYGRDDPYYDDRYNDRSNDRSNDRYNDRYDNRGYDDRNSYYPDEDDDNRGYY